MKLFRKLKDLKDLALMYLGFWNDAPTPESLKTLLPEASDTVPKPIEKPLEKDDNVPELLEFKIDDNHQDNC